MHDLRQAVRSLLKSPLITVAAVLSLAIGIGANAAIASLYERLLLRSVPAVEPARLVNFLSPGPKQGSQSTNDSGDVDAVFSYPMFRDLERSAEAETVLGGIAAHRSLPVNLAHGGETLSGEGALVSGRYFPVLGRPPALGRLLGPDDDRDIGAHPVVVLSHSY